jgi:sacsin
LTVFFSHNLWQVSVTVWEEGEPGPNELFGVRVDPARAVLRNPFQDKKWGNFKYQLSTMFGSSSSASKVHTIDMLLTENQSKIVDKWLVVQTLGSGHTRDMALDRSVMLCWSSQERFLSLYSFEALSVNVFPGRLLLLFLSMSRFCSLGDC